MTFGMALTDPITTIIAQRIIEAAKTGERDQSELFCWRAQSLA
jgi:hypothetical protein